VYSSSQKDFTIPFRIILAEEHLIQHPGEREYVLIRIFGNTVEHLPFQGIKAAMCIGGRRDGRENILQRRKSFEESLRPLSK